MSAWWVVVLAGATGLGLLALDRLRWAVVALAISLWLGAAIRAVVPERTAGGLVVRSRAFDVVALVVLGFFPGPALEVLNPAVERTLEIVGVGDTIPTVPAGLQLDSGSDH